MEASGIADLKPSTKVLKHSGSPSSISVSLTSQIASSCFDGVVPVEKEFLIG